MIFFLTFTLDILFGACSLCKYLMVASGRASVFILRAKVQKIIKVISWFLDSKYLQTLWLHDLVLDLVYNAYFRFGIMLLAWYVCTNQGGRYEIFLSLSLCERYWSIKLVICTVNCGFLPIYTVWCTETANKLHYQNLEHKNKHSNKTCFMDCILILTFISFSDYICLFRNCIKISKELVYMSVYWIQRGKKRVRISIRDVFWYLTRK